MRIYEIRLSKVDYHDLHKFFDFKRYRIPKRIDKYYVWVFLTDDDLYKIWYEAAEFGVYDVNHDLLGKFKLKNYSNATIISFYINDNNYLQAFLEYIQSTINEMKLAGFTILAIHEFDEDTTNDEIYNKYKLPKREVDRKKWRDVFAVISNMQKEYKESDEFILKK